MLHAALEQGECVCCCELWHEGVLCIVLLSRGARLLLPAVEEGVFLLHCALEQGGCVDCCELLRVVCCSAVLLSRGMCLLLRVRFFAITRPA